MNLNNIKTGNKLTMGFAVVLILVTVLVVMGIKNIRETDQTYSDIINISVESATLVADATESFTEMRRAVNATVVYMRANDFDTGKQQYNAAETARDTVFSDLDEYLKLLEENQLVAEADKNRRHEEVAKIKESITTSYMPVYEDMYTKLLAGADTSAIIDNIKQTAQVSTDVASGLATLKTQIKQTYLEVSSQTTTKVGNTTTTMIISAVATLILSIIIVRILTGAIVKPVNAVVVMLKRAADGDIKFDARSNARDEIGEIRNSLAAVIESINSLVNGIIKTSSELEKGDIEARIDDSKFKGAYKNVAESVNELAKGLISDTMMSLNCADAFAKGNFNVNIPVLPGKKIVLTNAFETLKHGLIDVAKAINTMIESASKGELDRELHATSFEGSWREIAVSLNDLLKTVAEPVNEASSVLSEVSKGNLSAGVKGHYKGTFAEMSDNINSVVSTVNSYVGEISDTLTKMSNQNLDLRISREYIGDYAPIKVALETIIDTFNELIHNINRAAEQVAIGARTISESSMELAGNSTQQASAVEELSASLSIVAEQTQSNAGAANKANELASEAKTTGTKGSSEMNHMLKSMDEINEASKSIGKIIKVIDDIAFQTNLLALNAAVEAARAGEHGKGFAVVAEEVRSLAGRSSVAAKETTELVENSILKTDEGSKTAAQTAEALNAIIAQVDDISQIIEQVSKASNEQNEGIGQINLGINQIANATQKNTATSEESAASAQELSSQSEVLRGSVASFKFRK
ncbi:hypothetical protein AGMMS49975_05700 [Clostridia bacterium]|nr:hypothetical protein AGMMS49975_05700 [Clostridia bacterium]